MNDPFFSKSHFVSNHCTKLKYEWHLQIEILYEELLILVNCAAVKLKWTLKSNFRTNQFYTRVEKGKAIRLNSRLML